MVRSKLSYPRSEADQERRKRVMRVVVMKEPGKGRVKYLGHVRVAPLAGRRWRWPHGAEQRSGEEVEEGRGNRNSNGVVALPFQFVTQHIST
jgi:hypothetical protein